MTGAGLRGLRRRPGDGPADIRMIAAGLLLLQLVWIFAVPPFRASDEFDHAYRAVAVAGGQWAPSPEAATRGTGAWLEVPAEIVAAAQPECSKLAYTGPEDCVGEPVGEGTVRIASGAGRYHPLYYSLIGTPAMVFDGSASLYVMRLVGGLLSWAFVVLALMATRCWARTRWPFVALVVGATPVLVYSTIVPAPNGLEMTAALALWSALVGLASAASTRHDGRLLLITALSGAVLVTLRSFGPMWAGLALLTVLLAVPVDRGRVREVLTDRRGRAALLAVVVATGASLAWIKLMGSLTVGKQPTIERLDVAERLQVLAHQPVLWVLQSVAAFPLRNEDTHVFVYVVFLLVGGTLVVLGLRRSAGRLRLAILVAAALSFLVPGVVTYLTMETYGAAWQGRYTLPYALGVLVLVGYALDRRPPEVAPFFFVVGGGLYVAAHTVSPVLLAHRELGRSPGVDNGAWILVPPVVLAVGAVLGAAMLWAGAVLRQDPAGTDEPAAEEVSRDRSDRPGVAVGAHR